jgi:hypothetical protein
MDDLEEELSGSGVEDEDGSVDGFCGEVSFEGFVDGNPIDVCVVDKPYDLVGEEVGVVLSVEVGLRRFRGVELEPLPDPFPEHVESRVGLHDLVHGLQREGLVAGEPISESRVHVVGQVDGDQAASGRWVDRDVVRGVVQELRTSIPLNIMRVVVSPAQLHVEPVLVGRGAIVVLLVLVQQARLADLPFESCEQDDVRT